VVRGELGVVRLGQGQGRGVGEVERHPAVGAGQAPVPGPEDLAGGGQLGEVRRLVVHHPARQHQRLDGRRGDRAAGELLDGGEHAAGTAESPAGPGRDALPRGQEPAERRLLDRLDLVAEPGERTAPELAQHLGVAPLRA
jgi:hypothetical protein